MHSIFFEENARLDLHDRIDFYENRTTGLGDQFERSVLKRVDAIAFNPQTFGIYEGTVRVSPIDAFQELIYYRIRGHVVYILAIIHSTRHPDTWKRRRR